MKTKTPWWYLVKDLKNPRRLFDLTAALSILGLTMGVASMVVSMAVFSGYEQTLKSSVQNLFGHVVVMRRAPAPIQEFQGLSEDRKKDQVVASTPFLVVESVLAHGGLMNGVVIEGVDLETLGDVIDLKSRLVAGEFALGYEADGAAAPLVMIGKGISSKFGLNVGDEFRVVIPKSEGFNSQQMRPKVLKLTVGGVLDFGRFDFDSRYIVADIRTAQEFAGFDGLLSGYRLKLNNPELAKEHSNELASLLGSGYWVRDWSDINSNLFEAVDLEKAVTFVILLILVIVACFNLSSQLIVGVVKRYQDIAILKTVGASPKSIKLIFAWQGLFIGMIGCLLGFFVGLILCYVLEVAQGSFSLVPSEVYKLDHIQLEVRFTDLVAIFFSTLFVSFLSTLIPSRLGAKMSPVKGLRYD